jgi:hypothetical protein
MSRKELYVMLTLDHLVFLVHNLQQAVSDFEARGFTVTPGGIHADGLTHNALVLFADATYLELIAFLDPNDTQDNMWGWRAFLPSGGLIDWCVASNDLQTDVQTFQRHGLPVGKPTEGGRQRPDGVELRWRSARFAQQNRLLPFLIEDVTPRSLRVPTGAATKHPNGATGINELVIAVNELQPADTLLRGLTNEQDIIARIEEDIDAHTLAYRLGSHTLRIAMPRTSHSILQRKLEQQGAGPFRGLLNTLESDAIIAIGS